MARSGATRYAVAPGDVCAHGAAWDKATDLAHFLSEAALYICSSGEWSADAESAKVDVRDVVLVARARLQVTFHEIAWDLDRWRCSRCQRYARNKSTLEALERTARVPLFGAARGATPSLPRVHSSHRIRRPGPITWCTMCGAYSSNRSFALRQCCPGTCPSDTRSQRLRQLVIGRHPITGAWLLGGAAQPLWRVLSEHCCSCVGIDISRSTNESNQIKRNELQHFHDRVMNILMTISICMTI